MDVKIIPILEDNYAYVIQSGDKVGVVDPGESKPIIQYLEEHDLSLDFVINTHKHWDHVEGNKALLKKYDATWVAPVECGDADIVLSDQSAFKFGDIEFQIFETKGHTAGHVVLFDPTYRVLFSGDTLFVMGCGRIFEGTMDKMYQSMQIIKSLPPETVIYCGHEYTATNVDFAKSILPDNLAIFDRANELNGQACTVPTVLATELTTNPFLIAENVDEFSKYREKRNDF